MEEWCLCLTGWLVVTIDPHNTRDSVSNSQVNEAPKQILPLRDCPQLAYSGPEGTEDSSTDHPFFSAEGNAGFLGLESKQKATWFFCAATLALGDLAGFLSLD